MAIADQIGPWGNQAEQQGVRCRGDVWPPGLYSDSQVLGRGYCRNRSRTNYWWWGTHGLNKLFAVSFWTDHSKWWEFSFPKLFSIYIGLPPPPPPPPPPIQDCNRSGPGSIPIPGVTCGLSLLLVLVLSPRVFLRVLRFSSFHKNQHRKFQFDLETGDEEPSRGSATAKFHYYYHGVTWRSIF